jgi:hypothetical protein
MIMSSRTLLVAAGLMAMPLAAPMTALAQQNNPTGNLGSNRSATASPGTADSKAASGMNTGDVGSKGAGANSYGGAATNPTTPGATGQAVVPGSTSSQANASSGTAEQKTGAMSSSAAGK